MKTSNMNFTFLNIICRFKLLKFVSIFFREFSSLLACSCFKVQHLIAIHFFEFTKERAKGQYRSRIQISFHCNSDKIYQITKPKQTKKQWGNEMNLWNAFLSISIFQKYWLSSEKNDLGFSFLEQMFDVAVWDIWSTLDIFCVLLDFDVGLDAKTRLKKHPNNFLLPFEEKDMHSLFLPWQGERCNTVIYRGKHNLCEGVN